MQENPTRASQHPDLHKRLFDSGKKPAHSAADDIKIGKTRVDSKGNQVYNTPVENTAAARKILRENPTPEQYEYAMILLDKGLEQQEVAESFSGKLASKSGYCRTMDGLAKELPKNRNNRDERDSESATASSARKRREARDWSKVTPVASKEAAEDMKHRKFPPAVVTVNGKETRNSRKRREAWEREENRRKEEKDRQQMPPPRSTNRPEHRHCNDKENRKSGQDQPAASKKDPPRSKRQEDPEKPPSPPSSDGDDSDDSKRSRIRLQRHTGTVMAKIRRSVQSHGMMHVRPSTGTEWHGTARRRKSTLDHLVLEQESGKRNFPRISPFLAPGLLSGLLHRQRRKQPYSNPVSPANAEEDGTLLAQ